MRKYITLFLASTILTGCALSPIDMATSVLGADKGPEITAQAGATNTRQAIGLTGNSDSGSEVKNNIKAPIGSLDSSSRKSVSASSISASTITAERIEIRNSDGEWRSVVMVIVSLLILGSVVTALMFRAIRKAR